MEGPTSLIHVSPYYIENGKIIYVTHHRWRIIDDLSLNELLVKETIAYCDALQIFKTGK